VKFDTVLNARTAISKDNESEELSKEAALGACHRSNIVLFGGMMVIIRAMDMNLSRTVFMWPLVLPWRKWHWTQKPRLRLVKSGGYQRLSVP
jgi:hypothetical protein